MQPLAVELQLLRSVQSAGPDLHIAPGRILSARVVELLPGGRATLTVAGSAIEPQVPSLLKAGQEPRLQVRDVHGGRVMLGIVSRAPPPPPPTIVPLPGGGTITTRPRDERDLDDEQQQSRGGAGAAAECSIALRYNAPALGPIDLSCRLDAGTLTLNLTL